MIFLPGGPGQSSITSSDPRIDPSYGFIQTDPRGVGCNNKPEVSLNSISSETLALDVIALIEFLKLDNYILYGISYGTSLATRVAFETEKKGIPAPKALVLEGVLSRSFRAHEAELNYATAWEKAKLSLPADLVQLISQDPSPLGASPRQWALWLKGMLSIGKFPDSPLSIQSMLGLLKGTAVERDLLKGMITNNQGPAEDEFRVYKQIVCREFYEHDYWPTFSNGEIKADFASEDSCHGLKRTNPFDVKTFPFRGTIYYFSGQLDPATPPGLAKYHFDNQPEAKKYLIQVIEGGHNSLKVNLNDCSDKIWTEILYDTGKIVDALRNCRLETEVIATP